MSTSVSPASIESLPGKRSNAWIQRLTRSPYFWTLIAAVFVTLPLLVVGFGAPRIVEIYFIPTSEDSMRLTCKFVITRSYSGPAVFDFCADSNDPALDKVQLKIRPAASAEWFPQGTWQVQKGVLRGLAQLGSRDWPLTGTEDYSFRLVTAEDDRTLAEGRIIARVSELAVQPAWFIAISLLASIVQVVQMLFMAGWKKDSAE